jgi:hypothetical protein
MMGAANWCFDQCTHNQAKRHFFEEVVNGKSVQHGVGEDTNKKLNCALGYKQTANNKGAVVMSIGNGSVICPNLRKLYFGKERF